jgi:type I restriction enzyme S subunit
MPELVLGEALEALIDHRGRTPKKLGGDFTPSGVRVISALLVQDGWLDLTRARTVSDEMFRRWMPVPVRRRDVIVTSEAPLGRCALVPDDEPYVLGQRVFGLRGKSGTLDSRFLFYALRSDYVQNQLIGRASGTTVTGIRKSELVKIQIPAPGFSEQCAIAAVLGALDDKIAVNERIAATSSALARIMMRALWHNLGITSLTAEHGPPVAGLERTTLGALCATGGGAVQTGPFGSQLHASDYVELGTPSVMPQNIGDGIILEDGIARVPPEDIVRLSKYLLAEGDIVYSRRGDVKRCALVRRHETGWLCGTGCLRVRLGDSAEPIFITHYLGEPEVQEWILQHAIGATMPNLNTSILGALPVALPFRAIRQRISADLLTIDARAVHGLYENRVLAALRDTLLPQLMSGKLRVRDAERIIEDTV